MLGCLGHFVWLMLAAQSRPDYPMMASLPSLVWVAEGLVELVLGWGLVQVAEPLVLQASLALK